MKKYLLGLVVLFSIATTVSANSGVGIFSPAGGEQFQIEKGGFTAKWFVVPTSSVDLYLLSSDGTVVQTIATNVSSDYQGNGNFNVNINSLLLQKDVNRFILKICVAGSNTCTLTPSFSMVSAPVQPQITSFTSNQDSSKTGIFTFSWMVSNATGVRIDIPCYTGMLTNEYTSNAQWCDYAGNGHVAKDIPVTNGDIIFTFTNKNSWTVNPQVTLTPLVNGVMSSSNSKIISFTVLPNTATVTQVSPTPVTTPIPAPASQPTPTTVDTSDSAKMQEQINKLMLLINSLRSQVPASNPAVIPTATPTTASTNTPSDTGNVVSACVEINYDLTYRSRDANTNGDVSALQDFLQAKGYLNSEPTGFFGSLTVESVKKFQNGNGIRPTGYVGSITKAKIKSLSCQ